MAGGEDDRRRRFDALFDAYKLDVAAYCNWRASSPSDAEDAISEVFLVAWRRLDHVPPGDRARIWLYATARRVLANQRRSRQRFDAVRNRIARAHGVARAEASATRPEEALVHDALSRLRPRDREILLLAEWESFTASEIAQVLGCLEVTARGRLHRARRRFQQQFENLLTESTNESTTAQTRKACI